MVTLPRIKPIPLPPPRVSCPTRLPNNMLCKGWSLYRHLIEQFIVSFFFACASSFTIMHSLVQIGGHSITCESISMVATVVTLILLDYIPGCIIAPWVTFGLVVARRMSFARGILSMMVQYLSAIVVVVLLKLVLHAKVGTDNHVHVPPRSVIALLDIVASFKLTLQILDTNVRVPPQRTLLLMSSMVEMDLNPAINLVVDILLKDHETSTKNSTYMYIQWIWWIGTFIGALAAAIYHVHLKKKTPRDLVQAIRELSNTKEASDLTPNIHLNEEASTDGGGEVDTVKSKGPLNEEESTNGAGDVVIVIRT